MKTLKRLDILEGPYRHRLYYMYVGTSSLSKCNIENNSKKTTSVDSQQKAVTRCPYKSREQIKRGNVIIFIIARQDGIRCSAIFFFRDISGHECAMPRWHRWHLLMNPRLLRCHALLVAVGSNWSGNWDGLRRHVGWRFSHFSLFFWERLLVCFSFSF